MLSNLPNSSTVFGRIKTQGTTSHREQIIANAKLLHGQEHTYDVVTREASSNSVTAYLIRYSPPSDEGGIKEEHEKAAALPIGQGEGEGSGNSGGFIIPRGGHSGHRRFSILGKGAGAEYSRNEAWERLLKATERRLRDEDFLS